MPESDRIIFTKYRTGSRYLKLLSGSRYDIPRDRRLCKCKEVQSLEHVILHCIYTNNIRTKEFREKIVNLNDFFNQDNEVVANRLMQIESMLKLR